MIVVSFGTVDILLKSKRGEDSIVSVLIDAIQENPSSTDFVAAACDVLANLSLSKKGVSKITRCGGGLVLLELIKSSQDSQVTKTAISCLYNLAYSSASLLGDLVKADCASSIITILDSSAKDPTFYTASFGLLSLLAGVDKDTKDRISNIHMISMVLDAIRNHNIFELELEAFSLLCSIEHTVDRQLSMNTAKRILESMETFPDEEDIQAYGCKILLGLMKAQPENRALRSLIRTGSGKGILSSVPLSCEDLARRLLQDL
jgi:hypothetical protein